MAAVYQMGMTPKWQRDLAQRARRPQSAPSIGTGIVQGNLTAGNDGRPPIRAPLTGSRTAGRDNVASRDGPEPSPGGGRSASNRHDRLPRLY